MVEIEQIEDDDEFEEFEAENWDTTGAASKHALSKEEKQWQNDWDDEVVDDGFVRSLRAQLQSTQQQQQQQQSS